MHATLPSISNNPCFQPAETYERAATVYSLFPHHRRCFSHIWYGWKIRHWPKHLHYNFYQPPLQAENSPAPQIFPISDCLRYLCGLHDCVCDFVFLSVKMPPPTTGGRSIMSVRPLSIRPLTSISRDAVLPYLLDAIGWTVPAQAWMWSAIFWRPLLVWTLPQVHLCGPLPLPSPSFTPTYKAFYHHWGPFIPLWCPITPWASPGRGVRGWFAPARWTDFSETWHTYPSRDWELLKRCSRSEVKDEDHALFRRRHVDQRFVVEDPPVSISLVILMRIYVFNVLRV